MDNFPGKKRPSISLSLFTTLSESFYSDKNKSPRNFETGVVGLGIVAAMTDLNGADVSFFSAKVASPKSTPIPIVSLAKPAANFRGVFISEKDREVDELSESYTCVISHVGNNLVKKRVYFDDKLDAIDDYAACLVSSGMFSASPMSIVVAEELYTADFLSSCYLCGKNLHGLDIFMYRGEKAFCSVECRDKQIRSDDWKEMCRSEPLKSLDYSISPCSAPMLLPARIVAA